MFALTFIPYCLQSLGAGSTGSLFSRLSNSSGCGGGHGAVRVAVYGPRRGSSDAVKPATPAAAPDGAGLSATPATQPAEPAPPEPQPVPVQLPAPVQLQAGGAPQATPQPAKVVAAEAAPAPTAAESAMPAAAPSSAAAAAPPASPAPQEAAHNPATAAAQLPAAAQNPAAVALSERLQGLDAALGRVRDGEKRFAQRARAAAGTRYG